MKERANMRQHGQEKQKERACMQSSPGTLEQVVALPWKGCKGEE